MYHHFRDYAIEHLIMLHPNYDETLLNVKNESCMWHHHHHHHHHLHTAVSPYIKEDVLDI
jgi:hypothetical protein